MSPEELVLNSLKEAEAPLKSGEIAAATKLSSSEVAKAIKALKTAEQITSPKRCYYTSL
ncbi:MarR family transcriptional regulator [Enterococcus xiangfangensis]|uniref:MarR family transcriptional regulator n=1 Tax=Enterococcus xiangfangensis TaxID=1296537 RepID=UPI0010F91267|nr:MarR family transcriptional regulator [Enterococcus xiangfangensis]MBM7711067.1 putative transcriptional regulator [Enterococcus xiangfangensis]NBK07759.1 MarR family transcriptional regulator [Enterococcus asini]